MDEVQARAALTAAGYVDVAERYRAWRVDGGWVFGWDQGCDAPREARDVPLGARAVAVADDGRIELAHFGETGTAALARMLRG